METTLRKVSVKFERTDSLARKGEHNPVGNLYVIDLAFHKEEIAKLRKYIPEEFILWDLVINRMKELYDDKVILISFRCLDHKKFCEEQIYDEKLFNQHKKYIESMKTYVEESRIVARSEGVYVGEVELINGDTYIDVEIIEMDVKDHLLQSLMSSNLVKFRLRESEYMYVNRDHIVTMKPYRPTHIGNTYIK